MTDEQQQIPQESKDILSDVDMQSREDKLETGLQILSFCIPIAGAIMYFIYQGKYPNKAKSACTLALWGLAVSVILRVLVVLMGR